MTVVDLYTIQIIADLPAGFTAALLDGTLAAEMAETEENLTDLLPAGYRARIRRWNDPDPDERNDDE